MKISARPVVIVAAIAALSALPLALVLDGMRGSAVCFGLAMGAGLAAAAWLAVLVTSLRVKRLGILVGALIGFMSFATVLLVVLSLPKNPGAKATLEDRAVLAALIITGFGPYPLLAGGLLGFLLRRMPLQHSA